MRYLVLTLFFLASCSASTPNLVENGKLTKAGEAQVQKRVPIFLSNFVQLERYGLSVGQPLDAHGLELARKLGVRFPEKVRVVKVSKIPKINTLQRIKKMPLLPVRLLLQEVGALTTGHAIYISQKYLNKEWVLAHELVHVAQVEQVGKKAIVARALREQITHKGVLPPIEREAIERSSAVLGITPPAYAY